VLNPLQPCAFRHTRVGSIAETFTAAAIVR